jgi:glutathione synthase/RimK-type ligase-like ATP-grasp enzyme
MDAQGVSIPRYFTDPLELVNGNTYVARTKLSGHSGDGIEVFTQSPDDLSPQAPLYTEYIEKVAEYRAIVVGNEVVDFKQKKKRNTRSEANPEGWEGEHDEHVWNLDGGYVFARNNVSKPDGIDDLSISAISALGLDFGAVDIIMDREYNLFVLEVNTAFGLEGTTTELVGEAIRGLL